MIRFARTLAALVTVVAAALAAACSDKAAAPGGAPAPKEIVLRVGHFPNVTHAHGLIAHAMTRAGDGWFE